MTHRLPYIVLFLFGLFWSVDCLSQTDYQYSGPLPCLGSQSFVNGALEITNPPLGAFSFEWNVTSPSGIVTSNTSNSPLGITFDEVGCWQVQLLISGVLVQNDPCGIEVFQEPTAAIDPISMSGCSPFSPVINDTSVPGTGALDSWTWSVGFCPTITDTNIDGQCSIAFPGLYDLTLSVIDVNGCFNTLSLDDAIEVSDTPPIASFTASSLYECNAPVDINFNADGVAFNLPATWLWTVDGVTVPGDEFSMQHTFTGPGTYDVCLIVTDDLGCADTTCQSVEVFDSPTPDFSTVPSIICAGMTVDFFDQSSPSPVPSIEWDLDGDGAIDASGNVVSYTYQTPGLYDAELFIAYSDHCQDSITQVVTVDPRLDALFELDTLWSCSIPFDVSISDMSSGAGPLTYTWTYFDASGVEFPLNLMGNTATFDSWGTYQINLEISNANGCFDSYLYPVPINLVEPQMDFSLSAPSTCVGDPIAATIWPNSSLEAFETWNYDIDCNGSIEQSIVGLDGSATFTFAAAGTYDLCLTATSPNGCSVSQQESIIISPQLFSDFSISDSIPCGIDSVLYTVSDPQPGLDYEWVFGDGNSSGLGGHTTYLYSYCDTGYFDITLNVSNQGCFSSTSVDSLIQVSPPIAGFDIITSCDDYYTVQLANFSILPDTASIIWTIDGVDMYHGEWEPSHTFSAEGSHEISLYVYNAFYDCADRKTYTVKINEPEIVFDVGPTTGCPPVLVDLVPIEIECLSQINVQLEGSDFLSASASSIWDLQWNVNGNVGMALGQDTIDWPAVSYNALGTYDISVSVIDVNGCQVDTTYIDIINVNVDPYFAQMDSLVTRYCDSTIVCVSPELSDLQTFTWSTNTGLSSTAEDTCFTFYPPYDQSTGSVITLTATDMQNCPSTVSDTLFFEAISLACISPNTFNPCKNDSIVLSTDCSICEVGPCVFAWDLDGDGAFDDSTEPAPVIFIDENGSYPFAVQMTDALGCQSYDSTIVQVHSPEIEVGITTTIVACNSFIDITNLSSGDGMSTNWLVTGFNDDGTIDPYVETDVLGEPQSLSMHENTIGVYDLYLLATNPYGCSSDSLILDFLGYGEDIGDFSCVLDSVDCAPFGVHCEAFNPNDDTFDYSWNMGDNTPYTITVVDHLYSEPGVYTVSLTMTEPNNNCTFSITSEPVVVTELEYEFMTNETICIGDTGLVEVLGLDSLIWLNDLEDIIEVSSQQWLFHPDSATEYQATGYWNGCHAEQTLLIEVALPVSINSASIDTLCVNQASVDLPDVNPSGGNFYLNDSLVFELSPAHAGVGNSQLHYVYFDSLSCPSHLDIDVTVNDSTDITFNTGVLCLNGAPLDLLPLASHTPAEFTVNYGSGPETTNDFDPEQLLFYPGIATTYTLGYTYLNTYGCESQTYGEVVVHPAPESSFFIENLCAADTLTIDNNSAVTSGEIDSHIWTFSDGMHSTEIEPTNLSPQSAGTLLVSLEISSDMGCTAVSIDSLMVFPIPQLSALQYAPVCLNTGAIPLPTVSPVGGVFSLEGSPISMLSSFDLINSGAIQYSYEDINGCASSIDIPIEVLDTTAISLTLPDQCIDAPALDLISLSSHGLGSFVASYGGGITDTITAFNPSDVVNYPLEESDYAIEYSYVNDMGCLSTMTEEIRIHPLPIPDFSVAEVCEGSELIFLQESSIGSGSIASYNWSIEGHANTSETTPLGLSYESYGNYEVVLILTSDQSCEAVITDSITIHPLPFLDISIDATCLDEQALVVADLSLPQGNIAETLVNWGDGITDALVNDSAYHSYDNWGQFEIRTTVSSDQGCQASDSAIVNVYPMPEPGMSFENDCEGEEVILLDESSIAQGSINQSLWDIPSLSQNGAGFSLPMNLSSAGLHDIIHTVVSNHDCASVITDVIEIYPLPLPSFSLSEGPFCVSDEITISNTSSIASPFAIDSMIWSIDGQVMTGDEQILVLTEEGSIDVQVEAISNMGCHASINVQEAIVVHPLPISAFALNPSQATTIQDLVQIQDHSVLATDWEYYIDDYLISDEQHPSYSFMDQGDYTIMQIVWSEYGCIDSSYQDIEILPELVVWVPNAITVDGDGVNEQFVPVYSGDIITNYLFQIFDRWGEVVFETDIPSHAWRGNVQGSNYYAKDEVYTWRLLIEGERSDPRVLEGAVTVLR